MTADPRHRSYMALFLDHYPAIFASVVRAGVPAREADDVVQEAAAVMWEKFEQFTPETNFRAWACAIARFEVCKWRDRQGRETRMLKLSHEALADLEHLEEETGGETLEVHRDVLRGCMAKLGHHARELLAWHYEEDLSYEQMSQRCGASAAALRVRMFRIRRWLERCVSSQTHGGSHV